LHWLNAILAALAYRGLPTYEQAMGASDGEWAFLPSDTAPELVLPLAAWLAFRRRDRLRALLPGPGPWWLWGALLSIGRALFTWATLTQAGDLLAPSLMFAGLGYACLFRGARAVRVMLLPAAFLLFAVPVPAPILNEIVFRLQIWSADYAGWILFLLGIPALVEGELVVQADRAFKVIETCSGFRSVVTLMMLSIVLSDLSRRPPVHSLAMLTVAPFVGFLLNGVRVAGLILNPHSAIAEVHNLQGVAILLVGLLILYGIDGALARLLGSHHRDDPPPLPLAAEPGPLPRWAPAVPTAVLLTCLGISIWLPAFEAWEAPGRFALFKPLAEVRGWTSSTREVDRVFLGSTGYSQHAHLRFSRGGDESDSVDVFLALGERTERRARSILSPKIGLPGGGWTVQEEGLGRVGSTGPIVRERVVRSGKHLRLVYHWYTGSEGRAWEALRTLVALDAGPFPRASEVLAIRFSTPMDGTSEEARLEASDLLFELYQVLRGDLDGLTEALSLTPQS